MEKEDKLEVPVEFDEGISKLLSKIEVKRKAKIEEHKKLLLKIEREKEEEEKRMLALEKENLRLEELDKKEYEENEHKLNKATANIAERQRRLEHESINEITLKAKECKTIINTKDISEAGKSIIFSFYRNDLGYY